MHEPIVDLTTVTLTDRERKVVHRCLTMSSAMFDALGDVDCATTALELAYFILPEGLRG